MILSFGSAGTEDIWNGADTKAARATCPQKIWPVARRKLDMLNAATNLLDLRSPPSNQLEKLKGDLTGKYSIRINEKYRVVFDRRDGDARDVVIVDYH